MKRHGPLSEAEIADVAASFQAAVVKMLVRRTLRAALHLGTKRVVLTGGVAAYVYAARALGVRELAALRLLRARLRSA